MSTPILKRSEFWWTLFFINLFLLFAQPLVAVFSAAVVLVIWAGGKVAGARNVRIPPVVGVGCVGFLVWAFTAAGIAVTAVQLGLVKKPEEATGVAGLGSLVFWVGAIILLRGRAARREQEQVLTAQRVQEQSRTQRTDAQKRREDARAGCEIFYSLHAPEIGTRFTRAMFDDFVARYMGDDHPPEYVEERATQLQQTLAKHLEKVAPPAKETTIEDLTEWYQSMRQKIEHLPVDGVTKRTQMADLNARYAELMKEHLENLQP